MGHAQTRIPHFPGFFTENRPQKPFLCRQFRFSFRRYFSHQDIIRTHFSADTDNSPFIQIPQGVIAHIGDIPGNFLRS